MLDIRFRPTPKWCIKAQGYYEKNTENIAHFIKPYRDQVHL